MGIPLYREPSPVAPSPQVKLPVVCPYASTTSSGTHARNLRQHAHQYLISASQRSPTMDDLVPITIDGQIPESMLEGPIAIPAPAGGVRRSVPRQAAEGRVPSAASRHTQRIVRSQPGTSEHEIELRAAEMFEQYLQEFHRYERPRHEPMTRTS